VVEVLERAVDAGGTTLSDFRSATGDPGYFQIQLAVYGREGQECPRCGGVIRRIVQTGRSTFYCPSCQR
jgi:formamidopyrimidine-DNA glycosylase